MAFPLRPVLFPGGREYWFADEVELLVRAGVSGRGARRMPGGTTLPGRSCGTRA